MSSKLVAILTTVLGAATAALAFLPYEWARIAAGSLAAGLAALHPINAGVARMAKGKNATQAR